MDAQDLAIEARSAAADKKAEHVVVLDLSRLTVMTDYFVICSGQNNVQVKAIADGVVDRLRKAGRKPRGMEGYQAGRWVLIDYGDVMVHVMTAQERDYYALDRLWGDARTLEPVPAPAR
ncbi:MAG: ribosome silencing factor [Thermaerobacterales bacterium]